MDKNVHNIEHKGEDLKTKDSTTCIGRIHFVGVQKHSFSIYYFESKYENIEVFSNFIGPSYIFSGLFLHHGNIICLWRGTALIRRRVAILTFRYINQLGLPGQNVFQ